MVRRGSTVRVRDRAPSSPFEDAAVDDPSATLASSRQRDVLPLIGLVLSVAGLAFLVVSGFTMHLYSVVN